MFQSFHLLDFDITPGEFGVADKPELLVLLNALGLAPFLQPEITQNNKEQFSSENNIFNKHPTLLPTWWVTSWLELVWFLPCDSWTTPSVLGCWSRLPIGVQSVITTLPVFLLLPFFFLALCDMRFECVHGEVCDVSVYMVIW